MVDVWQGEQVFKHDRCGTFEWEWEEDAGAWQAGIHWCLGCRDVDLLTAQVRREHPDGGTEGWIVKLYRGGDADGD